MSKTLNELVTEAHQIAKDAGWYDPRYPKRTALEIHALIHSEVSEATEAVREGKESFYRKFATMKPEGEQVELADAVIRIMDYFGAQGWDLENTIQEKMNYNRSRTFRHGAKLL